ncbi:unnamed protein product [Effrenium voratum]|uniref:Uncharacterized protein n=1 Tax=Effrenium voratum TaxID=2562239 RepID=A0AA36IUU4_9DINO|nr:unnamed protein product [Effrenium voratum]CAJ1424171.1 unnamed protein product [Effrenium voratum]|mmetsp:Transcript_121015/g.287475  ORF Transcript_121015/g.287475 Transcript_121015/m.287475 type:complete len:132 (-) Transcript_121015:152-547(-)
MGCGASVHPKSFSDVSPSLPTGAPTGRPFFDAEKKAKKKAAQVISWDGEALAQNLQLQADEEFQEKMRAAGICSEDSEEDDTSTRSGTVAHLDSTENLSNLSSVEDSRRGEGLPQSRLRVHHSLPTIVSNG